MATHYSPGSVGPHRSVAPNPSAPPAGSTGRLLLVHVLVVAVVLVVGVLVTRPPRPHPVQQPDPPGQPQAQPQPQAQQAASDAVRFDRYQQAERRHSALTALRSELAACREPVEANLVQVRMLLLGRHLNHLESRQANLASLDEDIRRLRQQIAGEQVERTRESLEVSLQKRLEARARMVESIEETRVESQHYRFMFEELPEVQSEEGGYIDHVFLQPVRLPVWESIVRAAIVHHFDASLMHLVHRFATLAAGLEEKMTNHLNWNPLEPLRVNGSIWDASRREDQLMEMQRLLADADKALAAAMERYAAIMTANAD